MKALAMFALLLAAPAFAQTSVPVTVTVDGKQVQGPPPAATANPSIFPIDAPPCTTLVRLNEEFAVAKDASAGAVFISARPVGFRGRYAVVNMMVLNTGTHPIDFDPATMVTGNYHGTTMKAMTGQEVEKLAASEKHHGQWAAFGVGVLGHMGDTTTDTYRFSDGTSMSVTSTDYAHRDEAYKNDAAMSAAVHDRYARRMSLVLGHNTVMPGEHYEGYVYFDLGKKADIYDLQKFDFTLGNRTYHADFRCPSLAASGN